MNKPLVSVIMPVYNAETYVAEALQSVFAQTYKNIEVICIDDGSTDRSLEILTSFGSKITLLTNETNSGIGITRNTGITAARGEYIAFLDADDMWKLEKLEKQLEQFQKNPCLDICFSYVQCFISPELSTETKKLRHCPPDPIPGYLAGASLIKRVAFENVGPFNPKWKVGEFIDWTTRAKEQGLVIDIVPDVFLLRRIHETNTGVTERPSRNDYIKIVREALERKNKK